MTKAVADSSAILAHLNGETGGDVVFQYRSLLVCAVNHAEIVGKLIDRGFDDVALADALGRVKYEIADFDGRTAEITGRYVAIL
jgi:PIN domain nuclease of toxin-antitoxin system